MSLGYFIRCTLLGQCPCPPEANPAVAETKRLLEETAAEWQPIKEQIAQEEKARPDLAALLQTARKIHEGR